MQENLLKSTYFDFANLVVLGETVVIKDCEYQRLVKGFAIRYLKNEYVGISWMYSGYGISRKCQGINVYLFTYSI